MKSENEQIVNELINNIKEACDEDTIESRLIKPRLIRRLYKQLGDPNEEDFPDECRVAGKYWDKVNGYTTNIYSTTKEKMKHDNMKETDWQIKYPSETKVGIVEHYTRAGWHCRVQAYNVMCTRYVEHPRYKDIGVEFYSSRDCNKYEYFIIKDEENE